MTTLRERELAEKEYEEDYNLKGCFERIAGIGLTSLVAGGAFGAVKQSFDEQAHVGIPRTEMWKMISAVSKVSKKGVWSFFFFFFFFLAFFFFKGVAKMSMLMGIVGVAFAAGECASQTLRQDRANSWVNQSVGGATAGFTKNKKIIQQIKEQKKGLTMGAITRSLKGAVGCAAALALLTGVVAALPAPEKKIKD
jgi:hypothetical protein